jgi:nicotinamidase-related amidase
MKMKKVLVIVDMQNDFVDGALGTAEAQVIAPKVADYIREHADKDTILLFTKDTHNMDYMETLEGKNLPVAHCIKDTTGWELAPVIAEALYDTREKYDSFNSYFPYVSDHVIKKPTFGSLDFQNLLYVIDSECPVKEITLMGLCTGICVLSNAILAKATLPDVPVRVVEDCCACVSPKSHETAIEAMKMCQIEIV